MSLGSTMGDNPLTLDLYIFCMMLNKNMKTVVCSPNGDTE